MKITAETWRGWAFWRKQVPTKPGRKTYVRWALRDRNAGKPGPDTHWHISRVKAIQEFCPQVRGGR